MKHIKIFEEEKDGMDRLERAEHSDLITLPENIEGTNCGNCKFFDSKTKMCMNTEVNQKVTARMCCKYWDAEGVKREWEEEKD
jgi:hypothetical protein